MRLSPDQVKRFYSLWQPLILFVNRKLHIEPTMLEATTDEPWDYHKVYTIREALWANDPVRHEFIAKNPAGLSAADLAIVASWDHRVAGTFYVFRQLKRHSLLIDGDSRTVYAVLGLASALDEVVPFTPCFAQMVLLPFEESIIYDSLIVPYNVYLGPGIRRNLKEIYQDAKERGAILTSLGPSAQPIDRAEEAASAVNARVLDAFRKQLYRSGLSPRVVERDVTCAAAFANEHLATRPEPRSLRNFGADDVRDYLAELPAPQRKPSVTTLRRLLRFLRDTERMDYHEAGDALEVLKGRG